MMKNEIEEIPINQLDLTSGLLEHLGNVDIDRGLCFWTLTIKVSI